MNGFTNGALRACNVVRNPPRSCCVLWLNQLIEATYYIILLDLCFVVE